MSLLMEALKRAEEAKRRAGENQAVATPAPAAGDLTLAPLAPTTASANAANRPSGHGAPLPDLSLRGNSLDADRAAPSVGHTAATAAAAAELPQRSASAVNPADPDDEAGRAAAHNVFAAKQPQPSPRPRSSLPLIFAVGGLAMVVLGAYFWWQLQALSTNTLAPLIPLASLNAFPGSLAASEASVGAAPPAAASPATASVSADTAPAEAETPAVPTAPPPTPAPAATPPAPAAPATTAATRSTQLKPATTGAARRARTASAPKTAAAAASAAPADADRALSISRSQPTSTRTIENAYDALLAGQFAQAQRDYEQVLRRDPKNTDALLGLATIAAQQNQNELAHQYYLAALETDPTDATAQAGLINSGGQSDLGRAESRLKTALASQPEASSLHFALGNVYARQSRWSEAQQAYFKAYSLAPDNADFIFNQAVSLDHLHQDRLAAQYYRMALAAADRDGVMRPVAFDRQQVSKRVRELSSQ